MAITAENACASSPNSPRCAVIDSSDASAIAPTPTGLMSYRWARLNSMPGGDRPSGLLITRSATTAIIQAIAMLEYSPSTSPSAWNTFISISMKAISGVEHHPHHAARVAVRQAREKVGPGQRAGIGIGHVDLELRHHDEQRRGRHRPAVVAETHTRRPPGTSGSGPPPGPAAPCGKSPGRPASAPPSILSTPSTTQPGPPTSTPAHQRQRLAGVCTGMKRR